MNILMIYPKYQTSFSESFFHVKQRSKFPPKEILMAAILLPLTWERKYIDLNFDKLKKRDLKWADYVIVYAAEKQNNSAINTIKKCINEGVKIIASGSLFTEYFEEFENVDHLALDDVRKTLPQLIYDLENEKAQKVYHSNPYFEIKRANKPDYSLRGIAESFAQSIELAYGS